MRAELPVMGTTASVEVVGGRPELLDWARGRLADLEARWSRFLPVSEVSRLNDAAGNPCVVSGDTVRLVQRALDGFRVTNGRFDPSRLGDVERAGYTASFADLGPAPLGGASPRRAGAAGIEVDAATHTVRIPAGVGFDPGGIGKGLAADLVVAELRARGARGACVNVGGDVRVGGEAPDGPTWRIAVADPRGDAALAVLALDEGAVATSSPLRRRWTGPDGAPRHHLIDPATGASAPSPVLAATVVAAEGWRAEVLAKVAFLDGAAGLELVEGLGAAAVLVTAEGTLATRTWDDFVVPAGEARCRA